jgi:hypothetical protein
MADELKDFRRKVGAAGRYQYEARVGKHDDYVLAAAIALWACVGRPAPVQGRIYWGLDQLFNSFEPADSELDPDANYQAMEKAAERGELRGADLMHFYRERQRRAAR